MLIAITRFIKKTNGPPNGATPFCLITENRLVAPIAFSNLLLAIRSTLNDMGAISQHILNIFRPSGSEYDVNGGNILEKVLSKGNEIKNNHTQLKGALTPYNDLYFLQNTGKKFIFPLFGVDSSFNALNNSFVEGGAALPVLGDAADMVYNLAYAAGGIRSFTSNLDNMRNGTTTSAELAVEEKGKQIAYPASGDTVTTSFTLYNTTKEDAWITNYKFLYLFYFRNLCYRTGVFTYKSPLMYDITIPGVKRLPFCCVSSINVRPIGNIRVLKSSGIINSDEFIVNVPEAWEVTIQFSSLIGTSANLMHPSEISGVKVTTK